MAESQITDKKRGFFKRTGTLGIYLVTTLAMLVGYYSCNAKARQSDFAPIVRMYEAKQKEKEMVKQMEELLHKIVGNETDKITKDVQKKYDDLNLKYNLLSGMINDMKRDYNANEKSIREIKNNISSLEREVSDFKSDIDMMYKKQKEHSEKIAGIDKIILEIKSDSGKVHLYSSKATSKSVNDTTKDIVTAKDIVNSEKTDKTKRYCKVVEYGENLSILAQRYYGKGSMYQELAALNNKSSPYTIYVGETIFFDGNLLKTTKGLSTDCNY